MTPGGVTSRTREAGLARCLL